MLTCNTSDLFPFLFFFPDHAQTMPNNNFQLVIYVYLIRFEMF